MGQATETIWTRKKKKKNTYHTPTLLVFVRAATFARGDSLEFAEDGGETKTVEAADVSEPGLTFEFQGARVRCCTYVMGSAFSCHFQGPATGDGDPADRKKKKNSHQGALRCTAAQSSIYLRRR